MRGDQFAGVGINGCVYYLVRFALLYLPSGLQNGDTVRQAAGQRDVVRDEDQRHALLFNHTIKQSSNCRLSDAIKRTGRLVGDQYGWLRCNGGGNSHTLLLSA